MRKCFTIIFAATALLCACDRQPKTEVLDLPSIRPSQIYWFDSVHAFRQQEWEQNAKAAVKYFDQGEALKDEDLFKAIWNYKRAITLNPLPEYYRALGEALIQNKKYREAAQLYYLVTAEHYVKDLHGQRYEYVFGAPPSEDDYYNRQLSYMLAYDHVLGDELSRAREAGIDIKRIRDRLLSDPRIKFDTASASYKNFLNYFLGEEEMAAYTSDPENFRSFISRIKDTGAVYDITRHTVADFKYRKEWDVDGDLEDLEINFLKQKQDLPDAWFSYNTRHAGRLSDSVWYVIYAIDTSSIASPKLLRHVHHTLATYTSSGKIIDARSIAWQSGNDLAEASVNNDRIVIKTYKRTWRAPYQKGAYDNEVLRIEPTGTVNMIIGPDGVIRISAPSS